MFPLFGESNIYNLLSGLFHGEGLMVLMIIVCSLLGGVFGISGQYMRHRERIAMIERGINPDTKKEFSEEAEESPEKKTGRS